MLLAPHLNRELARATSTSASDAGPATANPTITPTSGPLPSKAGLNMVIYNNADHLWRRPFKLNSEKPRLRRLSCRGQSWQITGGALMVSRAASRHGPGGGRRHEPSQWAKISKDISEYIKSIFLHWVSSRVFGCCIRSLLLYGAFKLTAACYKG